MKIRSATTLAVTFCFVISGIFIFTAFAQEVPRITKEELLGRLDHSDMIIIDVRPGGSELKIKGAVREDPKNVSSWIDKYPKDELLVFY
jgi:hypothetical protein